MMDKVSDLGEFGLIERIRLRLSETDRAGLLGDDVAIVPSPGDTLLYTTDVMVEGVDLDVAYCSGYDIGWKALAINVSDVAAMGGQPAYALVTLALRPDTPVEIVDDLVGGLVAGAARWQLHLAGGDVSSAAALSIGVALLGRAGERVVRRSGAEPGDAICVTGALGGAAAGLALLRQGRRADERAERVIERQLRPSARLREGETVARAGATAMIDVSDGLLQDLHHVLDASGAGCELDTARVPVDPDLASLRDELNVDPLGLALTGGEDFELLFTLPSDRFDDARRAVREATGTEVTQIGVVTEGAPLIDGRELSEWKEQGWDHLRTR